LELRLTERKSFDWFTQRSRTRGLELAHDQITKAFETVTWLHKATQSFAEKNHKEAKEYIESLYKTEEGVDKLRADVFMELSKGTALVADYREDLLHVVKRADTLADHTKDAARCLEMLSEADMPNELTEKMVLMTGKLVDITQILSGCIEKISTNSKEAINDAKKVEQIEHAIDEEYLKTKRLFVKYGVKMNRGAMVILDDLIEFIEQAADNCADTADYIRVLSSRE
jgi:predicted phosphate transport protein (TIGR00153 family)